MTRLKEVSILSAILGLTIAGARLQNSYLLYAMLGLICIFVLLVVFDRVDKKVYPYAVFIIGLSLLYQTTLMSNGLVGSDIHTEYYYYWLAVNQGWDSSIAHAYNSCIGIVILAPAITKVFGIDGIWIFKVIYPLFFAFVAPLLYLIFKKQFGGKIAFLSVFFFLAVPVWSLEMIGLTKQMLGELMLVACAYIIIVGNWRLRIRIPLLGFCVVLGALFHYVIGLTLLLYLGVSAIVLPFFKRRSFPVKWLIAIIGVLLITGASWYGLTSSGLPLKNISAVGINQVNKILSSVGPEETLKIVVEGKEKETVTEDEGVTTNGGTIVVEDGNRLVLPPTWTNPEGNVIEQQTPLIKMAFGLDFMNASASGKAFRIFQYITQLLLITGCLYLFIKKRKYSPEYLGFAGAGILLIAVCILVPQSLTIIGDTRVYHLALLFLAPALILGGQLIFRNLKILTICILLPYFLFTSGIIFEAFQYEDISEANIPYSISLSNTRVDVAALFTDNDMAVRDWAIENKCEPTFLDINGMLLFSEKSRLSNYHHICTHEASTIKDGWALLPEDANKLPDKYYIFLREWNVQNEKVTFKPYWYSPKDIASGMRQSYTFCELGLDKTIETSRILYRKGDAIIYGNKN